MVNALRPRYSPTKPDYIGHHDWAPYFVYYLIQCLQSLQGQSDMPRMHQDIAKIANLLRKNTPREEIEAQVRSALEKHNAQTKEKGGINETGLIEEKVNDTINLAARLYFMVNVGPSEAPLTTWRTKLQWTNGSPRSFLLNQFKPAKALNDVNFRFEKTFTARNIQRIAGITIRWTDDLVDHLRLLDGDKTVAIYHYASFLKHQAAPVYPPHFPPLYPTGFIEETLRTLALLFPEHDKEVQKWLQSQVNNSSHEIDQQMLKCGRLSLEDRQRHNFDFWHDRLVILKQAYDESQPSTVSQWWLDRRNPAQWYTFWVVIVVLVLTVSFGLVLSIEGALQVYQVYSPTSL
ncbi:Nn.00g061100.m01.CDS01 [Neocucurbitaria sp. VM-36]